jgi:hypothetical protein
MIPGFVRDIYYLLAFTLVILGCRGRNTAENTEADTGFSADTSFVPAIEDTLQNAAINKEPIKFYGDTVWVNPYGTQIWADTIRREAYTALITVSVDTTDFIIDTVRSLKGNRIVIGYNHYYSLVFLKKNKPWFQLSFDKKKDLKGILEGTDSWLESNLDVFRNLVYNKKYEKFIIEFDINPRYNYGSVFYIVFDCKGNIEYIGTSSNWGGGGPDGDSFLTDNGEMYITCFELYNFSKKASVSIPEYTLLSDALSNIGLSGPSYKQVHAVRDLKKSTFLVVFNQYRGKPEYNAVIMNTDTTILDRFRYKGLMEDMDAVMLFYPDSKHSRYFVNDTEREVLVCIEMSDSLLVRQIPVATMKQLPEDSVLSGDYQPIDFETFGSNMFYISNLDSIVFYSENKLE